MDQRDGARASGRVALVAVVLGDAARVVTCRGVGSELGPQVFASARLSLASFGVLAARRPARLAAVVAVTRGQARAA